YIENVIEANLKACKASSDVAGEVFNIAYGRRESLENVYASLSRALKKDIKPVYAKEREGDIRHSHADINKAKEMLGYSPDWACDREIETAIEEYNENIEGFRHNKQIFGRSII